ncbi:Disulphide bond corrector protein DsbC [bacterium A37T11]|nr:Disulphide bond corrector protein DsbC [bacterium A37T11]
MKRILLIMFLFIRVRTAEAQIETPVKWSYAAKGTSPTEAVLFLKATIDQGWHIYSVNQAEGGPIKTSFSFIRDKKFELMGKEREPAPHTSFNKTFKIDVGYFEKSVIFQQKITLTGKIALEVKGSVDYMVCNGHKCLPPETVDFTTPVR